MCAGRRREKMSKFTNMLRFVRFLSLVHWPTAGQVGGDCRRKAKAPFYLPRDSSWFSQLGHEKVETFENETK